ncbi:hypothetical protein PoB_006682700 [Plakobranchus ocellatus]|uniref:Uncharacterized protein n=1 Tax=Plakobranchus ocellatus TaxID=259542 RepID=A0AAV4D7U4_9GAST|nr:hypothetical protein PoB_006682700 [Plakobranchus ocellatus]
MAGKRRRFYTEKLAGESYGHCERRQHLAKPNFNAPSFTSRRGRGGGAGRELALKSAVISMSGLRTYDRLPATRSKNKYTITE